MNYHCFSADSETSIEQRYLILKIEFEQVALLFIYLATAKVLLNVFQSFSMSTRERGFNQADTCLKRMFGDARQVITHMDF
jgi:hypothetical protein